MLINWADQKPVQLAPIGASYLTSEAVTPAGRPRTRGFRGPDRAFQRRSVLRSVGYGNSALRANSAPSRNS